METVSFHLEMFIFTNFGLDIGVSIVIGVIFINKYLVHFFRIRFSELIKILIMKILALLFRSFLASFF